MEDLQHVVTGDHQIDELEDGGQLDEHPDLLRDPDAPVYDDPCMQWSHMRLDPDRPSAVSVAEDADVREG